MVAAALCILLASAATFATPGAQPRRGWQPKASLRTPLTSAALRGSPRVSGLPPTLMSAASDGPPRPSGLASVLKSPLLPIWLAVFVQMLGVGITLSTLPLMMTNEGISPNGIGVSATRLFEHVSFTHSKPHTPDVCACADHHLMLLRRSDDWRPAARLPVKPA